MWQNEDFCKTFIFLAGGPSKRHFALKINKRQDSHVWWKLKETPCSVGLHKFRRSEWEWLEWIYGNEVCPNVGLWKEHTKKYLWAICSQNIRIIIDYINVIPFISQMEVTDEIIFRWILQQDGVPTTHFLFHIWHLRVNLLNCLLFP